MWRYYRLFLLHSFQLCLLLTVSIWFIGGTSLQAAQSSADIPVSATDISKARSKILGSKAATPQEEYVIGHGDVIGVQVYGEGDMALGTPSARVEEGEDSLRAAPTGAVVRMDGRVSLRHIGDIEAVGFTLPQFADYLKELYASVYGDPIITVVLIQSNSRRYTVLGKVINPGIFYLDYPLNLVQLVARCKGFTEWASRKITVIRDHPKHDAALFEGNKLSFDYDDFLDGEKLEKNIQIQADDIVVID